MFASWPIIISQQGLTTFSRKNLMEDIKPNLMRRNLLTRPLPDIPMNENRNQSKYSDNNYIIF